MAVVDRDAVQPASASEDEMPADQTLLLKIYDRSFSIKQRQFNKIYQPFKSKLKNIIRQIQDAAEVTKSKKHMQNSSFN